MQIQVIFLPGLLIVALLIAFGCYWIMAQL
jgi:hypothetical protein